MTLPKELTKVTKLSKILAAILFILLPFVGFFLGTRYQQTTFPQTTLEAYPTPTPKSGCYYAETPEVACPMKDCGKTLICPTPIVDETANWKTYTDNKYNFLFKYPNEWIAGDMSKCTHGLYGVYLRFRNNYCEPEMEILVTQKEDKNNCFPNSLRILSRKDISIANLSAQTIVIENPRSTGRNETIVGFKKDNYCYSINNRVNLIPERTFDQILSTFQFTDNNLFVRALKAARKKIIK